MWERVHVRECMWSGDSLLAVVSHARLRLQTTTNQDCIGPHVYTLMCTLSHIHSHVHCFTCTLSQSAVQRGVGARPLDRDKWGFQKDPGPQVTRSRGRLAVVSWPFFRRFLCVFEWAWMCVRKCVFGWLHGWLTVSSWWWGVVWISVCVSVSMQSKCISTKKTANNK